MRLTVTIATFFSVILSGTISAQVLPLSDSKLSQGNWFRFSLQEEAVYKLTYSQMKAAGMSPSELDTEYIRAFTLPGGNLPQAITGNEVYDPVEIPIHIEDGGDGNLHPGDYILFYAQGGHAFLPMEGGYFALETNYYSTLNYLLLQTASPVTGKRITLKEDQWDGANVFTENDIAVFFEDDRANRLLSGREWYGDYYSSVTSSRSYDPWTIAPAAGSNVRIGAGILGYSFQPGKFRMEVDGYLLGEINYPAVNDYTYDLKGVVVSDTFEIASGLLSSRPEITLTFEPPEVSRLKEGYLDKLYMQYRSELQFSSGSLIIRNFDAPAVPVASYQVDNAGAADLLWDITDLYDVKSIPLQLTQNNQARFGDTGGELRSYMLIDRDVALARAEFEGAIPNQNLKGMPPSDLIIVTAPEFRSEAERLALHREVFSGLSVSVVDLDDIYAEFSSGRPDVTAIRNFMRYHYFRSDAPGKLKYALMFGKGSYDHRNLAGLGMNFVPIYQSRNSLSPLYSYGSDDYYGFLEAGEGYWEENSQGDADLEISVGRLPVKSATEAAALVDKLIAYDIASDPGKWKSKVVFIADDGDFNIHHSQTMQLSRYVDTTYSGIDPVRLFLDNYAQEPLPGGERSPGMNSAINRQVREGAMVINFTGHGGPGGWMQEAVLDIFDIEEWDNSRRLPLFVTATCEFGRHDNPMRISGGERTILNPEGGGIALVTTSRVVFSSTNFQLNKAFYEWAFREENGNYLTLGEVFRRTKNSSVNGVNNRNFALLGDPSMALAYPSRRVVIREVNEQPPGEQTVKALSTVTVRGEVQEADGLVVTGFNGTVELSFFDKETEFTTRGDENAPFRYKDWSSLIFQGSATVVNGEFTAEFVVPQNILYDIDRTKILMYAYAEDGMEASGSELNIRVGGSEVSTAVDTEAPKIDLYLNDRSFRNGGPVPSESKLLIDLYDDSGISITGIGVDNDIVFELDNGEPVVLNSYYTAHRDTYRSGSVEYLLDPLEKGAHVIRVSARDTYGNKSSTAIEFRVGEDNEMHIEDVRGVPNPFSQSTVMQFAHNKAGHDLEVHYRIVSSLGGQLLERSLRVEESPSVLELPEWYGRNGQGSLVDGGIYICAIEVRSLTDGTKNAIYCKLIYLK